MTPELVISVSGPSSDPIVALGGRLGADNVHEVTGTLLRIFSQRPETVAIDVSALAVSDQASLGAFIAISHHAVAWPGCALVMFGAPPALRAALSSLGVTRYVPVARDRDDARKRLLAAPRHHRIRLHLPPTFDSITTARQRARHACDQWDVKSLSDAAQTVVTELVTNSAEHAATGIELTLSLTDRFLYITVQDGSRLPPAYRSDDDANGYGLRLVEAFAAHWGHARTPAGKMVWAALARPRQRYPATRW